MSTPASASAPATPSHPCAPLRGRPLRHADLNEARGLLPGWWRMDPELHGRLPLLWTRLLGQSGFTGNVIEDLSQPAGQRLMALGVSVALDADWAARLRTEPPGHAGATWYRDFLDGRTAPLDDRALAQANTAGAVSMLVLHYGQRLIDPQHPMAEQLLLTGMQQFRQAHGGYRLADVWQEAMGRGGDYLQAMGYQRRTTREAGQPDLFGLSRGEAMRQLPGTPVRDVFQFVPPVMAFSGAERRMLRLALADLSDEDVAQELGVTPHTIKKLWRGVYDRATSALPELFASPDGGTEGGAAGAVAGEGTRGPEKRRHLLHYVRQHLEELRPCA